MTACRQSATQPHVPPVAPSPTDPSPLYTKKTKDISASNPKGEGMNCSRALYQNAAKVTLLWWQIQRRVLQHFVVSVNHLKSFGKLFWSYEADNESALLTKLHNERSQCSFSSSLCTPTHKHEHTNIRALYFAQVWDTEHSFASPQRIKHFELFRWFRIQKSK